MQKANHIPDAKGYAVCMPCGYKGAWINSVVGVYVYYACCLGGLWVWDGLYGVECSTEKRDVQNGMMCGC